MDDSTSSANEMERLPPIVLLLVGVLAGIVITALIFCFLAFKLKFCKHKQANSERKSSIQPDKTEESATTTPRLLLARNSTVESLAVSERWRNGYSSRKSSVDVLSSDDIAVKAVSHSLASNMSKTLSNDVILRVVSEHEEDVKGKSDVEATFDPGYPNNSIHSNPSIA